MGELVGSGQMRWRPRRRGRAHGASEVLQAIDGHVLSAGVIKGELVVSKQMRWRPRRRGLRLAAP